MATAFGWTGGGQTIIRMEQGAALQHHVLAHGEIVHNQKQSVIG
jgi:hypothetical protein